MNWIKDNTILLTRIGSHAYGTNVETSDEDFKAIVIPPISYYLGLDGFNNYQNPNSKDFSYLTSDGSNADISAIHLTKFVKEAMQGVPNNIEMLFSNREDIVEINEIGRELINNKHLFLSKNIYPKMRGYAQAQYKRMTNRTEDSNRFNAIQEHGYDTKYAMHSVRLLTSAIEILRNGTFTTKHPEAEFLKEIRNGRFSFLEVQDIFKKYNAELDIAFEQSKLPKTPNYNKINELLINLNTKGLNLR